MAETHQITILKKNDRIFTSISTMPIKDVYAMLYGAIQHVSKNTGQTVKGTLAILDNLDDFVKTTDQEPFNET